MPGFITGPSRAIRWLVEQCPTAQDTPENIPQVVYITKNVYAMIKQIKQNKKIVSVDNGHQASSRKEISKAYTPKIIGFTSFRHRE